MKNVKNAQVTLFVVIGIVIVLGILIYLVLNNSSTNGSEYSERVSVLRENLIGCFSDAYGGGVDYVSYRGGYYNEPEVPTFKSNIYVVPYYYIEGETYVPKKDVVEKEIRDVVYSTIEFCLSEAYEEQQGLEWYYEDYDLDVLIGDEDIAFTLDLNLNVIDGNETVILSFSDSPVLIPSKLNDMLLASGEIVESIEMNDASTIEMTHVRKTAEKYGFEIDVEEATEDSETYYYLIHQKNEQSYPYTLRFVVMHDFMEISFPEDMISIS